jgi:hypothetical protein
MLADGHYAAGVHTVAWDEASGAASRAAGVYFVRMVAGARALGRRVVVLP